MLASKRMPVVDEIPERGATIIGFYCNTDMIKITIGEYGQAVGHIFIVANLIH